MSLTDMQVFEQYAYREATEKVAQNVQLFNESTRGAITLSGGDNDGDYSTSTFWKEIPGLIRRRNSYGSGNLSAVSMTQDGHTGVKVAGGTPPIAIEPQQLTWIQKNPEEAGVVYGEQLGVGIAQDYINSAISGLVAGISANAGVVHDGTAAAANRAALVRGAGRFGDRANSLVAWVMHSDAMTNIYLENIANAERLFEIENISVMNDGFGRILIVTDSPALITSGSPDTYHTLGLAQGAAMVESNGDLFTNVETSNGTENIQRTMQSEYTFNLKLKGYSWDKVSGGASPTAAAIATGANWDKVVTDNKNTAGVLVNTQ